MNWLSILELTFRALPAIASGIVAVLHFSGADQHKTVAGQVANDLEKAGAAAAWLHGALLNGVQQQKGPAPQTPAPGPPQP